MKYIERSNTLSLSYDELTMVLNVIEPKVLKHPSFLKINKNNSKIITIIDLQKTEEFETILKAVFEEMGFCGNYLSIFVKE
jgi:hypothetical protein